MKKIHDRYEWVSSEAQIWFCFQTSIHYYHIHNHDKQTPETLFNPLAHCLPCEERWDGPPDQTWEPVSISIHDKKELYHTYTLHHFMFKTVLINILIFLFFLW